VLTILGILALYHDSAACLLIDGQIKAAAQEERFTRVKHDSRFPTKAIEYCLSAVDLKLEDLDYVVFYEKPFLKFERILETTLAFAPRGYQQFVRSMPLWIKEKIFQKKLIIKELELLTSIDIDWEEKLMFSEHHLSHAASAFYPSPFKESGVLTMDGVGEWATTTLAIGNREKLDIFKEIRFPHSLGLLYSAFTYYTGFKVNSGEYKLMGLAPYGQPRFANKIRENLIDIKQDGSFSLDMSYFDYGVGLTMTNSKFDELFGGIPREPESPIHQREMDLAASIQLITEEVIFLIAKDLARQTGQKNLCLAGGVALNAVANGKLQRSGIFDNYWIQPASGDAGGAIGAAMALHHKALKRPRIENKNDGMSYALLGPRYEQSEINDQLTKCGANFEILPSTELLEKVVKFLESGMAVGWMQGRMEFGPRALGARSILADPRSENMQKTLNLKIKFRESFRPFAPSVLEDYAKDWFDIDRKSPYMLLVVDLALKRIRVRDKLNMQVMGWEKLKHVSSDIPAVTHVDNTARVQTVNHDSNPLFYSLLKLFYERTGCPLLINTSFNVRGEPIVCTPEDAFRCFMGTNLDVLVIGEAILEKTNQDSNLTNDYFSEYELD
jgi:carbamoyltransferase